MCIYMCMYTHQHTLTLSHNTHTHTHTHTNRMVPVSGARHMRDLAHRCVYVMFGICCSCSVLQLQFDTACCNAFYEYVYTYMRGLAHILEPLAFGVQCSCSMMQCAAVICIYIYTHTLLYVRSCTQF